MSTLGNGDPKENGAIGAGKGALPGLPEAALNGIVAPAVNNDPVVVDDNVGLVGGIDLLIDLLGNDSDPDGDSLCIISAADGATPIAVGGGDTMLMTDGGREVTIAIAPDGGVTALILSQASDFVGLGMGVTDTLTFTYEVSDKNGGTATGTVRVVMGNEQPDAVDDTFVLDPGIELLLDLLGNDSDPDAVDMLEIISASDGLDVGGGDGTLMTNGGRELVLALAPSGVVNGLVASDASDFAALGVGESDQATFTYTVSDGNGGTDTALATINIFGPTADPECGGLGNSVGSPVTAGVGFAGTNASETIQGSDGDDTIAGRSGDDTVFGNEGGDLLLGNRGADVLCGGLGDDELRGGRDDDTVIGGSGDDIVKGDKGNDQLKGGQGLDMLIGGDGEDLFVIDTIHILSSPGNEDTIMDFEAGVDDITFANLGASVVSTSFNGTDTLVFLDGTLAVTVEDTAEADVLAGIVDEATVTIFSF